MNKTVLGTIVGTALLGLAKTKGSLLRLTSGYCIRSGTFPHFHINFKITDEFRKTKIKENCKGDERAIAFIEKTYKEGYLTKSEAEKRMKEAKNHQNCIKNNKGQCLTVIYVNEEKIKELAQKIMTMDEAYGRRRLEGPLRKNLMMITHVCGVPFYDKDLSWLENKIKWYVLNGSNEVEIFLEITGNPLFCIPGKIERVPGDVDFDDEDWFRASDEFIEKIQKELIQKVSEVINPFGFTVEIDGPYSILDGFDNRILSETLKKIYQNKELLVHKNGKWIPYKKPKETETKLRKR